MTTRKYAIVLVGLILLTNCVLAQKKNKSKGTPSPSANWEYYQGTEESIRNYYNNNSEKLDPIEGIFMISHKIYDSYGKILDSKENWGRLAIIKDLNNYNREFIEVNLEAEGFPKFAVTAEFTKATNGLVYLSKQYDPSGASSNENFLWDNDLGILSSETTEYYQGSKFTIKRYYLKVYPKSTNTATSAKGKASGTCFAISSDGLFATNFHVIENREKIRITIKEGLELKNYTAKVLIKDESNDIAIIKIDDPTFKKLKAIPYGLGTNQNIGEKVFTIGYPLIDIMGASIKFNEGSISSITGIRDDVRFYQISTPIQPGNSGGPLFNSKGELIGITTAKLNSDAVGTDIQNVNYAIKSNYLSNLIGMLPNKPDIVEIKNGVHPQNQNTVIQLYQDYIGIVTAEN